MEEMWRSNDKGCKEPFELEQVCLIEAAEV